MLFDQLSRWVTITLALLSFTILAQALLSAESWAQSRPAVSLRSAEGDLTATTDSPTAAATAAPSEATATPPSPGDTRTGRVGRLDPGMVRTLALISIVVAAIAGLYVYRIIRKGL